MPGSSGLVPRRSFKLTNPVFNRRNTRAPPIHTTLNSSGDSTGGSSEASSIDETCSSSSAFVDQVLGSKLTKSKSVLKGASRRRESLSSISSQSDVENFENSSDSDDSQTSSDPLHKSNKNEENETPYQLILNAMENDPNWRSERNLGRLVGMYKVRGEIGSGNFAKVRLGIHQLIKEKVAVKIIDKRGVEGKLEKMLSREISSMESLYHPNIVRLYEVMDTPSKLYLISEWAPAGDLYSKVTLRGRLSESEARPIFKQILSALTFMHSNGIVHRDLKAENIFFCTGTHCKVGDFGFATVAFKGQMLSTFCGSPPYAAPELFRDDSYEGGPVDVWALGVLLYFMIQGSLPFIASSIPLLKKAILQGEYQMLPTVSSECLDLVQGILQQRPFARLTISHIIRHSWLELPARSSCGDGPFLNGCSLEEKESEVKGVRVHRVVCRQDTTGILLAATPTRALSKTIPTREQVLYGLLSPPELSAFHNLHQIGITDSIIESHRSRGVKSHVIGIYRIFLHRLQEGRGVNLKELDYSSFNLRSRSPPLGLRVPSSGSNSDKGGRNGVGIRKQLAIRAYDEPVHQSTACLIL